MRKSISSLVLILATTVVLTFPAQAAAQGFQPGKFFSNLKDRVSNGAQRLYLRAIPGPKDGQAVLNQSTMAMEKVSAMKMDIDADIDVRQGGQSMGKAKFSMNGPVEMGDIYDPSTIREHLSFNGEFEVEGVQISAAGEMIADGTTAYYYRLTEIPLPMQQYAQLKNQWIKMDVAKLEGENKLEYNAEFAKRYQEATTKLYEGATISKARKEKWENHPVFVIDAEFDKDSIMTYIEDLMAIAKDQTDGDTTAMTLTDKDKEELAKVLDSVAPIKSTLWIDRSTFYLRHAELPLDLNVKEIAESVSGRAMTAQEMGPNMPEEVNLTLNMTFDEFNEPVTITIPNDARSIEELMREMMGSYYPSYPVQELPELTPAQQMQLRQAGYDY